MTYEGFRLKLRNKVILPLTCKSRRKKLNNENFTIISNNCWGGTIYESYGIKKQSPTVGMFFMASDYILFLKEIKKYLQTEMIFISPEESKWKRLLEKKDNWGKYPIARLEDIELHLLHYKCDEETIKKTWERRVKRINWDRLLVKFNDQNYCTHDDIEQFFELPYDNKIFFACKDENDDKTKFREEYVIIKQPSKYKNVMASYEPYGKRNNIDITDIINHLGDNR